MLQCKSCKLIWFNAVNIVNRFVGRNLFFNFMLVISWILTYTYKVDYVVYLFVTCMMTRL